LGPGLMFSPVVSQGVFFLLCLLHSMLEPGLIFFPCCWCLSSYCRAMCFIGINSSLVKLYDSVKVKLNKILLGYH
jgi:hypothetical protein